MATVPPAIPRLPRARLYRCAYCGRHDAKPERHNTCMGCGAPIGNPERPITKAEQTFNAVTLLVQLRDIVGVYRGLK